jgi:hypothetical protein
VSRLTPQPHDFAASIQAFAEQVQSAVNDWRQKEFTGLADEGRIVAKVNAIGGLQSIDVHVLSKRRLDNISLGEAIVEAVQAAEDAATQGQTELMNGISVGDRTMGDFWRDGRRTAQEWGGIPPM